MARKSNGVSAAKIALCGMLLAVMLVLGYIESTLPSPVAAVPGIKLGLSNGVLIFAVYMLDVPAACILMILKVMLSGFLFGNPSTMMYAGAGGVLSLAGMILLSRVKGVHPITVSMVGGVLHNVGQVGMAMLLLHTSSLLYYMAILMLAGLLCGGLTGVCANLVMHHLKKSGRAPSWGHSSQKHSAPIVDPEKDEFKQQ